MVWTFWTQVSANVRQEGADTVADEYKAVLVTGDPEFKAVAKQVAVEWLPRH